MILDFHCICFNFQNKPCDKTVYTMHRFKAYGTYYECIYNNSVQILRSFKKNLNKEC